MSRKLKEIIILILVLIIFVLVGMNTNRFFARIDLTENKEFTISKVSRELFQEIPERVNIIYFVSDKLRQLYTFPQRIIDLLNEYAAYSHGKIVVTVVDPTKTGDTNMAQQLGVLPQQIEVIEKNERSVAMVYTGIVIEYLDRHETLPVISTTDTLEYELTSKIRKVVRNEHKKIGIVIGNPDRPYDSYRTLVSQLSANFEVSEIKPGTEIPSDLSILMVIGNGGLDDYDVFPIDQYLMNGGKVLFLVDGVKIDMRGNLAASKIEKSAVLDMLKAYGIDVKRELLLDKYNKNFRIPRQLFGQTMWQIIGKYPEWITIASQNVSRTNPITARFQGLDLYWASPLKWEKKEGLNAEALVKTTKEAWVLKEKFETNPYRGDMLNYIGTENRGQYTVAYAVKGNFPSYFSGKPVPKREGEKNVWDNSKERKDKSNDTRIIVIGDSDFASSLFQYTDAFYNLDFVENCSNWLSNDEDLLSIKTRVVRDMRLNKIQDEKKRITVALLAQLVNVVLVPLLVVLYGVFRFLRRRHHRKLLSASEEG